VSDSGHEIYAWWEWFPENEVQISNFPVAVGQSVSCILTVLSNASGVVHLTNVTTGLSTVFQITAPAGTTLTGNSAEWIAERPNINGQISRLPDYGDVTFVHCSASTHLGITGLNAKVTLSDTSPVSPALASLNGRLYLAWKGDGNDKLNVMYSTDNGHSFGHKFTSSETSPQPPALCVHNGSLYVAWKGDGNDHLNVARVALSGADITGFVGKVTLADTSPVSPALASLNGRLYIAWKGDGNDNLNVMYSTDNGHSFGNKHTSTETSPQAPALVVHNNILFIAWKGDGNDNLNVAEVALAGAAIAGLSNKVTLADTSPVSPTLASLNGHLFIGWKGDGNNLLNVMFSDDNGHSFGNKFTSPETSPQHPALVSHANLLFVAWKGNGNDNLNVAEVRLV